MFKKLFKKTKLLPLFLAFPFIGLAAFSSTGSVYATTIVHEDPAEQNLDIKHLASLIAERLQLAEDIAVYQWNHKLPIDNPITEKAKLDHLVIQAKACGVNENFAERFFLAQIDALNAACITHFETWVQANIHKHSYTPEITVLNQKLDAVDHEIMISLTQIQKIDKVQVIHELQNMGLSREVIDAAINF